MFVAGFWFGDDNEKRFKIFRSIAYQVQDFLILCQSDAISMENTARIALNFNMKIGYRGPGKA